MIVAGHETHPAADVFPLLDESALNELAKDIAAHGLREPIWRIWIDDPQAGNGTRKPLILDGRNRLLACERARIEPTFRNYEGNDPVGFVVSLNLHRRHLTVAQRAFVAEAIANLQAGSNQWVSTGRDPLLAISIPEAAKLLGLSPASVSNARVVKREGVPELADAVVAGSVGLRTAAEIAKLPHDEQRAELERRSKPKARAAKVEATGNVSSSEVEPMDDDVPDEPAALKFSTTAKKATAIAFDERVFALVNEGLCTSEIASKLGVKRNQVQHSKRRLGVIHHETKASIFARRLVDTADEFDMAIANPHLYYQGASADDVEAIREGLTRLVRAAQRLMMQLKKEAA
jgi:hypothetical protein